MTQRGPAVSCHDTWSPTSSESICLFRSHFSAVATETNAKQSWQPKLPTELETDTSFSHHQICTYKQSPDWCVTVFWQHCTQEVFQLKNNNNKIHTKPVSGGEERTRDKESGNRFDRLWNVSGLPAPDTACLGALISPWVFPGSFQSCMFSLKDGLSFLFIRESLCLVSHVNHELSWNSPHYFPHLIFHSII